MNTDAVQLRLVTPSLWQTSTFGIPPWDLHARRYTLATMYVLELLEAQLLSSSRLLLVMGFRHLHLPKLAWCPIAIHSTSYGAETK